MILSEKIDLGLGLPRDFEAGALFPGDRLLRLHPNWFIQDFQRTGKHFSAKIKDYATEETNPLSGMFRFNSGNEALLEISLADENETSITFSNLDGTLHVQIRSQQEIEGTDPLLLWVKAIREYVRIYAKKTPATLFFRLLMNRMVLQMNPSQRKICLMIARLTIFEIFIIILIVVGYVIFVL
jgi:hypothetical protein